ncbi:hypothetical protein GLAREA_03235 [Glarea lozoyensis ATCC 20868]|uniref:Uncharacterized protein n=1 Tax=Glarea lozoyensis (strain ATCC 20868 / MF5171) TaxID=1116229 RepID=S3CNP0_GLAL2|nr:uncharacterized protein GLAREA_03235 [Glarea lozoyensis ATCC 20868]EPE27320.1 hypothetical protein GLAREA_03235 [Glarea lozoyensis ATCC 20868]
MPLKGGRYANGLIELVFFVNGTGASVGVAMDGLSGCLRRATPPTLAPRFDYSRAVEVPGAGPKAEPCGRFSLESETKRVPG